MFLFLEYFFVFFMNYCCFSDANSGAGCERIFAHVRSEKLHDLRKREYPPWYIRLHGKYSLTTAWLKRQATG